ncbi:helix-turn-helix domain-containing protein [Paracidovorax konjaci]|nr:helix-turn-helix transcriptional regulator [Paracidovorax konjaci]
MASSADWDTVVGLTIAVKRRSLNMTQEALASAALVHRNYLADVERGLKSPTVRILYNLAVGLQTTPDKLLKQALSYLDDEAKRLAAVALLPERKPGRPPKQVE